MQLKGLLSRLCIREHRYPFLFNIVTNLSSISIGPLLCMTNLVFDMSIVVIFRAFIVSDDSNVQLYKTTSIDDGIINYSFFIVSL